MTDIHVRQNDFLRYAASPYAGIDGGDISARYWFVGIEWANFADHQTNYAKWQNPSPNPYSDNIDIDNDPTDPWILEHKLDKIYKALPSKKARKTIFASDSDTFKLNLFPLPFPGEEDHDAWTSTYRELTGFASFKEYIT